MQHAERECSMFEIRVLFFLRSSAMRASPAEPVQLNKKIGGTAVLPSELYQVHQVNPCIADDFSQHQTTE
jgi:hypothetical protein